MIAIAADPKHLGARIGITAVLHTWGSALTHHPRLGDLFGKKLTTEYVDKNRVGDHICYISDLRRFENDYPKWRIRVPL